MSQFIGRGESNVGKVLGTLFGKMNIISQYHLKLMCKPDDFEWYDPEVQKHKFDFYVGRYKKPSLIVEVNYEHGDKADRKWNNIFCPLIEEKGWIPVAIEQRECKHLFKDAKHKTDLDDWVEILQELKRNGVEL
jgi:hypothetical protein